MGLFYNFTLSPMYVQVKQVPEAVTVHQVIFTHVINRFTESLINISNQVTF
jgi:hypothetical protein